ncbi:hypothetical protein [Butyrivibrio sp. AC2005]|uniref:hypothetical protein n=1 Tax=Butyrivibrio sp. AC2005 TaxID=1280672 RepID=UPI00047E3D33|nr:hypothetical protein [Butyrivibrio sp. AC2005]
MEIDLKKLEEKYSKNKPTFSLLELVICIALVMIGCVLFCAMPDEMGIWGWILFVAGTFLNVVGVFRFAAMVPEAKSDFPILVQVPHDAIIQMSGWHTYWYFM